MSNKGMIFKPIFSISNCEHSANFFFIVIKILSDTSDNFQFDRIESIICEHLFAKIRYESNGDNKILSVLEAFKRTIIIANYSQCDITKN